MCPKSPRFRYQIGSTIFYATRPLWDTPGGPTRVIPHYHADGQNFSKELCTLHGWGVRDPILKTELWDAVLFNVELDLLQIRLNELNAVVDKFFIIESDRACYCF